MAEDASAGGDDFSGLGGFFFYMFIVHPITAWILRPGRFERKKSILYAIAFLAALAAVKTGLEIQQQGPNHYQLLDVTRESNPLEIKRSYKKLGLKLHPDKNPSPNAADEFDRVKQAYDVLMDLELRDVYNKFGKDGVANNKRYSETQFLIEVAIFYVSWAVMAFLLTMGKKSGRARDWTFTGMIVMLVVEVVVMTSQTNPIPSWLFPTLTEHDLIRIMHSVFPAFMNGCRSLGSYLFVDVDAQLRQFLLALQEQNKDILLVLRDVQIGVQNVNVQASGGCVGGPRLAAPSTGNIPVTVDGGVASKATPTGKIKELQDRLQYSNATIAQAVQPLKTETKSSNLGFYGMILGYIVISYLFG
uniref:J domain-containing protein n=1 Tax=Pseudo-nitzschia australis TaxID=44445 RepID=A0A7S4EJZ0_9STRA|mmetsp:Transcript_16605/g.36180  ORF Transcript_16605/g.36180 Transcript_16605/m.36180 type:complete len:360 (-) Transcript_16605:1147-2226(-)|eukprot:CAMPEP_0168199732 /NCGR_PEP_ID=MMETSP0139_2-20121125/22607_1 /TAXON_ID=44445 /ORGANISM="Pseudo-nitzschia australis, Strain 10249 10 AB" /LENGTH=359 /DNA_ID=CAMNT_0008124795 /DNA_START=223 /DNA_END=1302 /DNA_ORIENTATION=+